MAYLLDYSVADSNAKHTIDLFHTSYLFQVYIPRGWHNMFLASLGYLTEFTYLLSLLEKSKVYVTPHLAHDLSLL